ncbi:MAG: D-alanyl-D-alanine carboxypeptidase [Verrucomicrobia bacterium]|nr:D-alanyl-D-alanine carboxypeptidase [Verrucomicrobiota bacterium]
MKVEVSAPSAVLMNAETGAILYAKNIHEKQFPASITKIATALYVLEKKGAQLDKLVEASHLALKTVPAPARQAAGSQHPPHTLEHDGTMMGIRPGEMLSLHSLMHGLMLSSGNDAANVLAEYTSGSIDQFVSELNQYLQSHGIQETRFSNPHGLHHAEHWTTAYDMALMTRLALKHAAFREIVKTTKYQCPPTNKQPSRFLSQHNRLVKPGPYFYPKAIGVKTGYVAKAGHTFVGAATHEGRTLIAVLLGCSESEHRFRDSIKLFEAAFREKLLSRVLFAKEKDRFSQSLRGAKAPLDALLKEDLVLKYYPAEEPAFRAEITWNPCKLPIKAGDVVGHLRLVEEKGNSLKELPLFAAHDVDQKWWAGLGDLCQNHKKFLLAFFLGGQIILMLVYLLKKNQKVGQR